MNVEKLDYIPEGYYKLRNATTAPKGYSWYKNRKSFFSKECKIVLVKENQE